MVKGQIIIQKAITSFIQCSCIRFICYVHSVGLLVLLNSYSVKWSARVMVILFVLKFLAAVFILVLGIREVAIGK